MRFLSACAIVKNESLYLREWVLFHQLQGIEHFYLYHNAPLDKDIETLRVIGDFVSKGIATYEPWAVCPGQFTSYNHCLRTRSAETKWTAFLDCDEFLYSPQGFKVPEVIEQLDTPEVGAIAAHWQFWGSNGHEAYRDDLVINRFTKHSKELNKHVKSIVKNSATRQVGPNPHTFRFYEGVYAINDRGCRLPIDYTFPDAPTGDSLRIAHFHTKSHDEYVKRKVENPDVSTNRFHPIEDIEARFKMHDLNEVEDQILSTSFAPHIAKLL